MSDWTDNPFAAPAESEPFSDPSVTDAAAASTMPEYDPFSNAEQTAKPKTVEKPAPVKVVSASKDIGGDEPDWAQPSKPAKAKPAKPAKMTKEEKRRQAEYERNQQQAADPQAPKDPNYRPANWPPFPSNCYFPFKPCFHHDFKGEIPEWGYGSTKALYYHWVAYFVTLCWNFIACCAGMSLDGVEGTTQAMFLALAYIIVFGILAYSCWFQSLYQAMRKDSSLRFGWFFFTFSFQWLTCIFFIVGAESTGSAGLMYAIDAVQKDKIVGIVMFTAVILWILMIAWATYIIRNVLLIYRSSGQSLQKAQQEAVTGAVQTGLSNA